MDQNPTTRSDRSDLRLRGSEADSGADRPRQHSGRWGPGRWLWIGIAWLACLPAVQADNVVLRTGPRFRTALQEPLSAAWKNEPLRAVVGHLVREHQVCVLLDRRVDPQATPEVVFANDSLRDGLMALGRQLGGGISVPNNVMYLGPEGASRKLRTLIALRSGELSPDSNEIPAARRQLWQKTKTVRWDDLESPRDILVRLQADWEFQIANIEAVEHDLWAAATLPAVDGVEALALILVQFDLTWAWREAGTVLELVPIPETVVITRSHRTRGKSPDKLLAEWSAARPEIAFRVEGREIVAEATVEEHEELASGVLSRTGGAAKKPVSVPLKQQKFTLKIKDLPARSVMDELEKTGVRFVYDAETLAAAGVELDRTIELDVRDLSAEEFLRAVFDPLGAMCRIDGMTVTLTPK